MLHLTLLIAILLAGCVTSPTASSEDTPPTPNPTPNVILIYADDMGYGEIQALNPTRSQIPTPYLNQLIQQGRVFTDAHTTSSVCTPSRYALLTGRYNWRTHLQRGVLQGNHAPLIAASRMTLGHLFQQQGYRTALVGKWHLGYTYEVPDALVNTPASEKTATRFPAKVPIGATTPNGPITRGFDTYYGFHHAREMSSFARQDTIEQEIDTVDALPKLTDHVVQLIDEQAQDAKNGKPFFIYFAQSSPHTPIVPADAWKGKGTLGAYSDFVAQTDGSVGAVMQALERNGLTDNTLLIFSADNGTSHRADFPHLHAQGHHPSADRRGSKSDLWDGGHREPVIVRWPGHIAAGSQSHQLISLMDLMATFGELLGANFDPATAEDSISFLPALLDTPATNPRQSVVHHSIHGRFAIREAGWKLLLAPGSGGWTSPTDPEARAQGLPAMQLYNLNHDPGEQHNLVDTHPDKAQALLALLKDTIAHGRSTPGAPQTNDAPIDLWKTKSR